jgi:peptidoglycan hydrolase-like protein with peptidoglycan-binding domain
MRYIKYILVIFAFFLLVSQAVAFSGTIPMKYGSRGQTVVELQTELKRLKFFPDSAKIDGRYGRVTLLAVQSFQVAHNLTTDGIAGRQTLALMREDTNITGTTTVTSTSSIFSPVENNSSSQTMRNRANTPPTITLLGPNPDNHQFYGMNNYADPGYTAYDQEDGNITSRVTSSDQYDNSVYCSNTWIRTYKVTDNGGITVTAERRITGNMQARECAAPPTEDRIVATNTSPTITLLGANPDNHQFNGMSNYVDPGYNATDKEDGNLTSKVTYTDGYDNSAYCSNTWIRIYQVTDSKGATATAERHITGNMLARECAAPPQDPMIGIAPNTPPIITLYGLNPDNAPAWGNSGYIDPGYTATDSEDGNITTRVKYTDQYDPSVYCSNTMIRTYTVTDNNGATVTVQRKYTPPFVRECAAPPVDNQMVH